MFIIFQYVLPFVALDVVLESDLNALENSDISCENNP